MKAMRLHRLAPISADSDGPLVLDEVPVPEPAPDEVLIRVTTCGVCHTELDEIEGRTPPPTLPMTLGHQVVGTVARLPTEGARFKVGQRVGVAWIASSCGQCDYCREGRPNLCPDFKATGRDCAGGYAEYMTARPAFVYPIPDALSDESAAPLLCAGAIGYRSLKLCELSDGQRLGLTGFGASGHLVLKMVRFLYPSAEVAVFARSATERAHALALGAAWAGAPGEAPPHLLHAIIDTTPVWKPVLDALRVLRPGGRLVINAIRKEGQDIDQWLGLSYPEQLWMEKEIKSVANITPDDVREFLQIAAEAGIAPEVQVYALADANRALKELRAGQIKGAKVLRIAPR
ncbi:alcohol dehydrogenase catalytic domain-containing protein [Denitromonas iodatirespirans]|uniref:Alcohol dehydrogenase catalytic domain-containing protein n=1 Tax=Denitromonas iodatirespirans TaxID=2795389 RepID=A0A944H706_DENI1|nr:alcohol dehydrogenase catalytic domain-containing protein [Denitromonas iodatirespirans]MBT0960699.1 alcohol dehydrogenase catalytic domain-containing protein [Denitromonas iodatirespirans]